ncbi:MAG: exopolysaccharide biosynthesis protein [Proteobacteria bacterium]|nr:exopolysaccharide biosynthesis protein [Pseudomonadota bacterium]
MKIAMQNSRLNQLPELHDPISVVLNAVVNGLAEEKVSVGTFMGGLQRRSFGGILIVLALLGMVPGVSFFAGLVMIVPAIQMMIGLRAPAMPRFVRARELRVDQLRLLLRNITPRLQHLERYVRPRWTVLTDAPMPNIAGLMILVLALVIMVPIPFSNFLPAFAVVLIALGLLERDGIALVIGLVCALLALIVGVFAVMTVLAGVDAVFAKYL